MARVLVCLTAVWLASCSSSPPEIPQDPNPAFEDVAAQVGLDFQHSTGATGEYYLPEIMGSGVALLDYDSDGDLDIYLLQGAPLGAAAVPDPPPVNRLYRNELVPTGELRFTDVTARSGLGHPGYGMGVAVGDYDGDDNPDLFVTNFGPNVLYRNNGDGTFSEATPEGMADPRWSTSAAFVDYDLDGDLDLVFVNYVDFAVRNNKRCADSAGAPDYCSPKVYDPVPDRLFRNDGGDRWTDVSVSSGLGAEYGNGLGVTVADMDNDGLPDIYIANDGTANQLWRNRGDGTFENTALFAGAAYNADGMPEAGMGVAAEDFDFDGDEDLFLTHLAQETNTLYVNDGRGAFRDLTSRFGLASVSMPYTGFGIGWLDYDLDGDLDIFAANGAVTKVASQLGEDYPFRQPNQLFRRESDHFVDASAEAGAVFELEEVSRGAAFGDVDNDGDTDIVVSNNNGPARLLLNRAGDGKLSLRLQFLTPGARVALLGLGVEPGRRTRARSDGSYLSASELSVVLGVEDVTPREVEVLWPSGQRERFSGLDPGEPVLLLEGEGPSRRKRAR